MRFYYKIPYSIGSSEVNKISSLNILCIVGDDKKDILPRAGVEEYLHSVVLQLARNKEITTGSVEQGKLSVLNR